MPETTPVVASTVATDISLLLHVPPPVPSLRVVVAPSHTLMIPVIATGIGNTLIVAVVRQPVGSIYVMTAVPAALPVTIPVIEPTDATVALLLVHVPPLVDDE